MQRLQALCVVVRAACQRLRISDICAQPETAATVVHETCISASQDSEHVDISFSLPGPSIHLSLHSMGWHSPAIKIDMG